ncbi:PA3371 family protein [Pseudomonas lopnurensis]|uniref:PA3371 family protein n=1 Tax=Pseudomonas lopnurensis TaxID=1477517 RepID=UPI0028A77B20|nr:PA3371 family protein [Pseudomonas lopnurensis]
MSKFALSCLLLASICAAGAFLAPADVGALGVASKGGLALFGILFVIAMLIGRRIKFDPVLR